MFETKVVGKIKTHILCSVSLFPDNRVVSEIMWKNTLERGWATDDNMVHAHCMTDN